MINESDTYFLIIITLLPAMIRLLSMGKKFIVHKLTRNF